MKYTPDRSGPASRSSVHEWQRPWNLAAALELSIDELGAEIEAGRIERKKRNGRTVVRVVDGVEVGLPGADAPKHGNVQPLTASESEAVAEVLGRIEQTYRAIHARLDERIATHGPEERALAVQLEVEKQLRELEELRASLLSEAASQPWWRWRRRKDLVAMADALDHAKVATRARAR